MKYTKQTALRAGAAVFPRAIAGLGIRADASDPKALFAELQKTVKELQEKNDKRLDTVEAKVDPLDVQQINALNEQVGKLQTAMDEQARQIAASKIGGIGSKPQPENPEYTGAFQAYVRKNEIQAAMSVGSNPDGGYTAPVEWDRTISEQLKLISPMRQYATVQAVGTAGFTRLFSDRSIGSGWVGETASRPATTTPQLSPLAFGNGEIYANPQVTQQLLDDSVIDIEAWLTREVAVEFDRQENIAFLSGNGTNKPNGLLTYVTGAANAATHPWGDIDTVVSGGATAITADAVVKLVYALPSQYQGNARFFGNMNTQGALRLLKDGQGNYLWQPSYQAGQPATLMGRPLVDMPDMANIAASAIPLLYGDMAETYLILDRMGIRVIRDALTNKPYVGFYTIRRVGGGVQNPAAMKAMTVAAS